MTEEKSYTNMERFSMGDVKVGMVVMINNRPCKINYVSTSKTGKHGHAKTVVKGSDLITDKHIEFQDASTKSIWSPKVTRKEMALIDVHEGFVTVFDDEKGHSCEYKLIESEDVASVIYEFIATKKQALVTVLFVNDEHRILSCKNDK